MTFVHPFLLPLTMLSVFWIALNWGGVRSRLRLVLKGLSLAAILAAVSEPTIVLPQVRVAEVVLVDTSASIGLSEVQRGVEIAQEIVAHKRRNWARVLPFENGILTFRPADVSGKLRLLPVSANGTAATNIEAALRASLTALPPGYLPRIALLSDGNENEGSVLRVIAQLQRLRVPVDTIPLGTAASSTLRLEGVSMPPRAYSGEEVPIALNISSAVPSGADLDIFAEGKRLGHQQIELHTGENHIQASVRIRAVGVVGITGQVKAGPTQIHFQQALQLRRPHVLYLSEDPPGSDTNLLAALAQANMEISRDVTELDRDPHQFELVILNNLDLNAVPLVRKKELEQYVRSGGGLLLIGGERQIYKEDQRADELDRVLPAKLAPPDLPKGTCVVLIIDKSSSMEGRKIELARLSGIGVVDHLKPTDMMGVLIFDNSFQWAVPIRRAEDKGFIKRLISGITPDGGTQIAPALSEAYRRVLPTTASYKHIVLMTDGISEEGDSIELAREAAQHDITISTVGLGQDVNRSYLEKVAATSGGRSYFLDEPGGLEQILLKDVQTYSGSTAVEKTLTPLVSETADILEGVDMEHAPALRGYARYTAKPGSETLLAINPAKHDPLYVRWQYGLGRAAVFTSDAKSRWAEGWIGWPGFDKFWINLARDLLRQTQPVEAIAEYDSINGDVVVNYELSSLRSEPASAPALYLLGPNNFHGTIDLKKSGPRSWQGRFHIGTAAGLFRVRPAIESSAFPEVGLYRPERELENSGINEPLLREIARGTGGRFNPPLSRMYESGGRHIYKAWPLWPLCLTLAIALTIAELAVRKSGSRVRTTVKRIAARLSRAAIMQHS